MDKKNLTIRKGFRYLFFALPICCVQLANAADIVASDINKPAISIIIDDMGYHLKSGMRAINLQGALTFSFLPHTPHAASLSKFAHQQNKEVMLHLPMESEAGRKLGPGGLMANMNEKDFTAVLESNIQAIPHASGFNNHMGSLLTKDHVCMTRVMQKVASKESLFFVDSMTTNKSIALQIAQESGLKGIKRDVFIDHELSESFMLAQLNKLILKAKLKGTALAIAHPKKLTLKVLENWLAKLDEQGVRLVAVSKLIQLQQQKKLALLNIRLQ